MDNEAGRFTLIFLGVPGRRGRRGRAHPQLGRERLWRRPQFRPSRLSGRRHLRDLPAADGQWRDDQPAAARRPHGLRPHARQHFDRAAAGGRRAGAGGALGVDAEHRRHGRLARPPLPRSRRRRACRSSRRRWPAQAGSSCASAAMRGGALGSLPCAMLTPDQVREQVADGARTVDRPLNLNFFCHAMPEQAGRQRLARAAAAIL